MSIYYKYAIKLITDKITRPFFLILSKTGQRIPLGSIKGKLKFYSPRRFISNMKMLTMENSGIIQIAMNVKFDYYYNINKTHRPCHNKKNLKIVLQGPWTILQVLKNQFNFLKNYTNTG